MRDVLLQPGPELAGPDKAGPETEAADESCRQDGHPGHAVAVEAGKYRRRMALDAERVEQPGACKEGVVAGREDTGENDGVDDAAGGVGAGHLKDNGKWRGGGLLAAEVGIGVRDVEADEEDGKDAIPVRRHLQRSFRITY